MPAQEISPETWQEWVRLRQYNNIDSVIDLIMVQVQKGNEKVLELLGPILTPRYPSQLFQAVLEGLLVFVVLVIVWRKPQKPGVISACFGITYAVMRIVGEQFRMPDSFIGYQWLGLTRGQWLSVGFLVFAIGWLVVALRRKVEKIPGRLF
jgi:phosphatidylglycerol:prolipoprotein diacylglycerol transferase